jgi:hypothetical protein
VIGFLAIGAAYMVPTPTSATRTLANALAVEAEGLQSGIRRFVTAVQPHSGARGTKPISNRC